MEKGKRKKEDSQYIFLQKMKPCNNENKNIGPVSDLKKVHICPRAKSIPPKPRLVELFSIFRECGMWMQNKYCIMHYRPCNAPWADPISLIPMTSIKNEKREKCSNLFLCQCQMYIYYHYHHRGWSTGETAITRWKLCTFCKDRNLSTSKPSY